MYKREVGAFMVQLVIVGVLAGWLANSDTFGINDFWTIFGLLGTVGALACCTTLAASILADKEKDFFLLMGVGLLVFIVLGVIVAGVATTGYDARHDGVDPIYDPVVWSSYAYGIAALLVSGGITYLVSEN